MESFKCKRCGVDFRDGARCSVCKGNFDFPCSGITEAGYRKLGDRKTTWKCPTCKGALSPLVMPSTGSAKSPVPADLDSIALDIKRLGAQIASLPDLMATVKAIQADISDLKTMKSDIEDLKLMKPDVADMKVSVEFMQNSVETLTTKISDVNQEVQGLLKTKDEVRVLQQRFDQLESDIREMEQRSRINNIEIKGVPLSQSENLFEIVAKIGSHIGCSITKEQINYIARIPMRNDKQNKTILVSVHNRYIKEDFVAAAKKCTTAPADLGLRGDKRIFVNDHLTVDNKMLLNKAKALAKERGFAYIWVKGCKIFARKSPTSNVLAIKSESDLKKIS